MPRLTGVTSSLFLIVMLVWFTHAPSAFAAACSTADGNVSCVDSATPNSENQVGNQTDNGSANSNSVDTNATSGATGNGAPAATPTTSAALPPGCSMVGATPATPGSYFTIPRGLRNAGETPTPIFQPGTPANPGTEQCANPQVPLATQPAPLATLQQTATTLLVQWEQQLDKGTIGYVPDKAPMLVGLPGCFWLNGVSGNTQTTQTVTSTFQGFSFSVKFRFTASLKQVDWTYGDGSQASVGDAGVPWVYQHQQFCSNPHTYKTVTNPAQSDAVTASEEW